jgi:hypothetical protein
LRRSSPMKTVSLSKLRDISKIRPAGYLEDCLSRGKEDGYFLILSDADYAELCQKYRGAGDIVTAVAQPIAKAIDAIAGTNIQNCGGCKQRQDELNKAFPLTR